MTLTIVAGFSIVEVDEVDMAVAEMLMVVEEINTVVDEWVLRAGLSAVSEPPLNSATEITDSSSELLLINSGVGQL